MHDYKALEQRLIAVINDVRNEINNEGLKDVCELIEEHREYGEAYHLLCYLIVEKRIAISPDISEALIEVGKQLGMEKELERLSVTLRTDGC